MFFWCFLKDQTKHVNDRQMMKVIDHTIVPYNTTKQDHHTIVLQTFNTYHLILSLTQRLAFLLYIAFV
jgi:hypothetical protein